ncbi:MAG: cupin domain-containing protein [Bacteroidales bacterium]|nr:cupin domain-containing protein [Bacteroidales bacterium]MCF6342723.1 cupin domain-containing protein [Bacteroidales bacterium]
MKNRAAGEWIEQLEMHRHPEGGYYKEVYRSPEQLAAEALPRRFAGARSFSTSIYYLLRQDELSRFHRISADETWHFYDGWPLELISIDPKGKLKRQQLGLNPGSGLFPQLTIPYGHWFAARPLGVFSLVGCTVSPGFDFADFELAERRILLEAFPQHKNIIEEFTSFS